MHKIIEVTRWLLVVPVAVVAYNLSAVVTIILFQLIEGCFQSDFLNIDSLSCNYSISLVNYFMIFGACLASVLIIIFSVLMAPYNRIFLSKLVFIVGATYAVITAYDTSLWYAFVSAIICGALTLFLTLRILHKSKTIN